MLFTDYEVFLDFTKSYVNRYSQEVLNYIEVFIRQALENLISLYDWRPQIFLFDLVTQPGKEFYFVSELSQVFQGVFNRDLELKKIADIFYTGEDGKREKLQYFKTYERREVGRPKRWWVEQAFESNQGQAKTELALFLYPVPDKEYRLQLEVVGIEKDLEKSDVWKYHGVLIAKWTAIEVLMFLGEFEQAIIMQREAERQFQLSKRRDDSFTPTFFPLKVNFWKNY